MRIVIGGVVIVAAAMMMAPMPSVARADEPAAAAAAPTIEDIIAELKKPGAKPSAERLAELASGIGAGNSARQRFARALLAATRGEWTTAREEYRALVKQQPRVAEYQSRFGSAIFSTINEAGDMEKLSLARDGRAAFEAAVELDPNLIEPRQGLAAYFINAPALVGGSHKKAKAQGEALLTVPDGAFAGRMILAQVAAAKEEWDEMAKNYLAAETAGGAGASALAAQKAHASALLNSKKDPAAALAIATKAEEGTLTEDVDLMALRGLSLAQLKRWEEARKPLERVIELRPAARRSRIALGYVLENLNEFAAARAAYAAYLELFPEGEQAREAKAGVGRMDKKLQ